MTNVLWIIVGVVIGIAAGIFAAYTFLNKQLTKSGQEALKKAEADGEIIKKEKILQAKEKFLQLKNEYEKTVNDRNRQLSADENRLKPSLSERSIYHVRIQI